MPKLNAARRALENWAEETGYASFETYLACGGTISEARLDLMRRVERANAALWQLGTYGNDPPAEPPAPIAHRATGWLKQAEKILDGDAAALRQPNSPVIGPEALARLEADASGAPEPVDLDNAHPQGAEHAC